MTHHTDKIVGYKPRRHGLRYEPHAKPLFESEPFVGGCRVLHEVISNLGRESFL